MTSRMLTIGAAAVLGAAFVPGAALATPGQAPVATEPPPPAVVSELLARGSAGELHIRDRASGVRLHAADPTDMALVKATLAPGRSTGWHGHAGPSLVIVKSGTLTLVQPGHGGHRDDDGRWDDDEDGDDGDDGDDARRNGGCTTEVFGAGQAFGHPSHAHDFVNDTAAPVEFYIAYLVPAGASPAPIPADVPFGCRP